MLCYFSQNTPSSFLLTLSSRFIWNSGSGFDVCGWAGMYKAFQTSAPGETERHKWLWSYLNLQPHQSEVQSLMQFVKCLGCRCASWGICLILFWFRSLFVSIWESGDPIWSYSHKPSTFAWFFLITNEIVLLDMINMQTSQATVVPVSLNNGTWIKHLSPGQDAGSLLPPHPPMKASWATNQLRINTCCCICVFQIFSNSHHVLLCSVLQIPAKTSSSAIPSWVPPLPKPPPTPFLPEFPSPLDNKQNFP